MAIHIDFQGRMLFTYESLVAMIGMKAIFSFHAKRFPSTDGFEDSPGLVLLSDTKTDVPPHSRGQQKLLGEKDE